MNTRNHKRVALGRRAMAIALAFAAALLCDRASAADPAIPASGITNDTFLVVHMVGAKVDPASVEAAARSILGANFPPNAQEGLSKYKEKYEEYSKAGAESVTMVVSGDPTKDTGTSKPQPLIYLKLKPGSDHAAVEQKIRADEAKEGKGDDKTEISHEGDYLVMREKGTPAPSGGGNADRAKLFSDAMSGADKAIAFAFVPTDPLREKMKKEAANAGAGAPPWAASLAPLLADSKWARADLSLGDSPTMGVTLLAADENSAKQINDITVQASQQLKAMADQLKQAAAQNPQFAQMATSMGALADSLKPTQDGAKVKLSVDGKTVGPAVMSMVMMYGGGAGGAPKAGGGGL
jgi:hypothetical protein